MSERKDKLAVVLTGGGSRGAYQAGVLRSLAKVIQQECPNVNIDIWLGMSAGAINASHCASHCDDLVNGTRELSHVWGELTSDQVIRTDIRSMGRIAWNWIRDASMGSFVKTKKSQCLLDPSPLADLLEKHFDLARVQRNIKNGDLEAFGCVAFNYSQNLSAAFIQAGDNIEPWEKFQRYSEHTDIRVEHIMASSAIPFVFPTVKIQNEFYGDGTLRNYAPLSTPVHLGATKILTIGVRPDLSIRRCHLFSKNGPSVSKVMGTVLNSLFFDSLDADAQRLDHLNRLKESESYTYEGLPVRKVDHLWLRPSESITSIAEQEMHHMPGSIRHFLSGLGPPSEAADLASYMLFESAYTKRLIRLGMRDCIKRRKEIVDFLNS